MGVSILLFVVNVWRSRRVGIPTGPNPWNGPSLEWAAASPPANYNFARLPTVIGREALWERTPDTPVVAGLSLEKREVLSTTILDAQPEHKHELSSDSIWPFVLALVTGFTLLAVIFHPIAFPLGLGLAFPVLFAWFWRDFEPRRLRMETLRRLPS